METLAEFQSRVQSQIRSLLLSETYLYLRVSGERGRLMHNRMMLILKALYSLTDTTFTPEVKTLIENELSIRSHIFYARVDIQEWVQLIPGRLYTVNSNWGADIVDISMIPDFSEVTDATIDVWLHIAEGIDEDGIITTAFDITDIDRRRQELIEWARTEYHNSNLHSYGSQGTTEADTRLRNKVIIFRGFIYNTLWVGLNDVNRNDNQWNLLKNNLRSWKDFAKFLGDTEVDTIFALNDKFYDGTTVWLWNSQRERTLIQARIQGQVHPVTPDASIFTETDIPAFGLPAQNFNVREVLDLEQPFTVHQATLSTLELRNPITETAFVLTPTFTPDTYIYTSTIPNATVMPSVVLFHQSDNHVNIQTLGDTSIPTNPTDLVSIVSSQDGQVTQTYTISVSRSE